MHPNLPANDLTHVRLTYAEHAGCLALRDTSGAQSADLAYDIGGQLDLVALSVPNGVPLVSDRRIPAEVSDAVVGGVIVPVAALQPIEAQADERKQNKVVNLAHERSAVATETDLKVAAVLMGAWLECRSHPAEHAPVAGHLVAEEVWHGQPGLGLITTTAHSRARVATREFTA